jgi:hypothetical protein
MMVAGYLVVGSAAGLLSAGGALLFGYPIWLVAAAYMAGGTVGLGLSIIWCLVHARIGDRLGRFRRMLTGQSVRVGPARVALSGSVAVQADPASATALNPFIQRRPRKS